MVVDIEESVSDVPNGDDKCDDDDEEELEEEDNWELKINLNNKLQTEKYGGEVIPMCRAALRAVDNLVEDLVVVAGIVVAAVVVAAVVVAAAGVVVVAAAVVVAVGEVAVAL
ncbi:hypothetical protein DPMN_017746 [Dreissena polymorpha]|uniref:Uncharacterized protein n=1 Tax=Dreissena polymorpha TaxID=45954 RepID=A0A9D4NBZ5_DREPO|nr:hypothetical protein DPMN_017746 [Dreissena polymorpha]